MYQITGWLTKNVTMRSQINSMIEELLFLFIQHHRPVAKMIIIIKMLIKKLIGVTVRQYRDKSVISSAMRKQIHIIKVITLDRYG